MISGLFCCDCGVNMIRHTVAARCCFSLCPSRESSAAFCKLCFARRAGIDQCTQFASTFEAESLTAQIETTEQVYLQAVRFDNESRSVGLFCNKCVDGVFSEMMSRHVNSFNCLETLLMSEQQLGPAYAQATFDNFALSAPSLIGSKVPL